MKTYRALFIFPASMKEEALEKVTARIRDEITKLQGNVTESQVVGRRTFTKPLKKLDAGYYVRVTFSLDPANVRPFQVRLKLIEEIFRVQIVAQKS